MPDTARLSGFVYLSTFERVAKRYLNEELRRRLEQVLIEDPEGGAIIEGGVRKLRFAREGRGKSGDMRVICYYRASAGRIYMITLYAKNEQANLTKAQRNQMRQLTAVLNREA